MSVLSKGTTFSTGQQVTATNLNNVVDSATFLSGATDSVTTQLSGGAIIVKDGGISTAKLADSGVTTAKIADGAITTAKLATPISITSSIASITLLKLTPELGYSTSGTITLTLTTATNAYIGLTGNTTLAVSGQASGIVSVVTLKNTTGAPITMAYPAWTAAGGSFPASLTAGQAMVIKLYCYGTALGNVFAVSSI